MREWLLILVLAAGLTLVGCSGGGDEGDKRGDTGGAESTKPLVGSNLGHQAFQPSTRLVVPDGVGTPFDRVGRVLAGLAEGPLGVRMFANQRPGEDGFVAFSRAIVPNEKERGMRSLPAKYWIRATSPNRMGSALFTIWPTRTPAVSAGPDGR